ncbi:C-type lectin domain family 4 member A isoform X1 [Lates calcarifer]|uniref:C-type lectin domain family 4 member A isoform X1 n=1 Tax=Lates calcarifer TaxID=8187 RepID=A0AAJ8B488_LATCA|nr:C-type lectin domain family 4 member A isoform X1 [Lates calcarifer]
MSSDTQAKKLNLKVRYNRRVQGDSGEGERSERVEILKNEDQFINMGLQKTGPGSERNLPGAKRSSFRVTAVILGVFYFLILVGVFTRYILVTVQRDQLNIMYEQLKHEYDNLSISYNQSQQEVDMLKGKGCPDGWMRSGSSCYYRFTESKSLNESREDCEARGGQLMILNSTEKQRFEQEAGKEAFVQLCG